MSVDCSLVGNVDNMSALVTRMPTMSPGIEHKNRLIVDIFQTQIVNPTKLTVIIITVDLLFLW